VKWGVAAAAIVWAGAAGAVPLSGTLTLGSSGVSPDTGPLDAATSFTTPSGAFYSMGSGGFLGLAGVPAATTLLTFSPSPVAIPGGTGAVATTTTLTGSGAASGFGTFTASSEQVIARAAQALSIVFLGTYTPNFGGFDPNEPASLVVSLTRSVVNGVGNVSFSGTLATTGAPAPSSVPEPASMAVLGAGLLGLGLVRRRKAN
jgi:hypothetical protein